MSTVHASVWNAQTLDNRWWFFWALRLNCPPFLHPGLCNDALSVWEHQSAFILPELLGCLAQHGRRAVRDELLSPPQQHLRTPTRQTRDGGRKEWGRETNMKSLCNATVDEPPLCVQGGERVVEWNRHRNQSQTGFNTWLKSMNKIPKSQPYSIVCN